MSAGYVLAIVVAVLVTGAARVLTGARSIARDARRARGGDMTLLAVGLAGLAFHCGAMFYRPAFRSVPGFRPAVDASTPSAQPVSLPSQSRLRLW